MFSSGGGERKRTYSFSLSPQMPLCCVLTAEALLCLIRCCHCCLVRAVTSAESGGWCRHSDPCRLRKSHKAHGDEHTHGPVSVKRLQGGEAGACDRLGRRSGAAGAFRREAGGESGPDVLYQTYAAPRPPQDWRNPLLDDLFLLYRLHILPALFFLCPSPFLLSRD